MKPRCLLYVGVLFLALVGCGLGCYELNRAWLAACKRAWEEEYYGLDEVLGQVEVLVPRQRNPGTARLSPGGTRLLVGTNEVLRMIDLVDKRDLKVDMKGAEGALWVTDDLFALQLGGSCYFLVDAGDMTRSRFEKIKREDVEDIHETLKALVERATQVYIFEAWSPSIWLEGEGFRYAVSNPFPSDQPEKLEALLAETPHLSVPVFSPSRPGKAYAVDGRLYSPDNRYYAVVPANDVERVSIYTSEGKLVAQAYNKGWGMGIYGWTYDGSGVIFVMGALGSSAGVFHPEQPIYKLLVPGAVKRGTPVPMSTPTPTPTSEGGLPGATVFPLETLVP